MHRRRLLALSTPLFAVILLVVASCTPGANRTAKRQFPPLPPDTLTLPTAQIGSYGGRFTIAQTSSPRTYNALLATEQSSREVTNLMFAALANLDYATMRDYGELAKSWESSADGLVWTWHLRRGARFSDGHPLTSEDVLFSFQIVYDDSLHPSTQDLLKLEGRKFEITAPDSYTVVMKIPRPYPLMVDAVGAVRIMPRHVLERAYRRGTFASAYGIDTRPESLVTSGPWKLKEFRQGEKTVIEPNPWWIGVDAHGQRLPYLNEVVFVIVPDQNTAALKFQAGDVDGIDNVKPEDYSTYADAARSRAQHYTLYDVGTSMNSSFFWFNLNRITHPAGGQKAGEPSVGAVKYAWFSSPAFRRAISKAIDRDAIIRGPYFGSAVKNWSPLTPGCAHWHVPGMTGDDYDPEGSKRLLASLGLRDRDHDGLLEDARGNVVSFTLKTNSDNNVRVAMCNFIRDDLARVGVRVTPVPVEMNALMTNTREDFRYDAALTGLGTAVPCDPGMYQNFFRSSGVLHYWHVRQTAPETAVERDLDRMMDAISMTRDSVARHTIWVQMQRRLNDACFVVWLPSQIMKLPVRDGFGNVRPMLLPHRLLWNIDRVFVKPRG
jgi:peptide/nickel transport system substrate-binding protein